MPLSQIWTLLRTSDALEQTLAAWGVSSAVLTRRTQRPDELALKLAGAAFDEAELFPFSYSPSPVALKRNGAIYFIGVATHTPRMGRPQAEGVGYMLEGPWWWLEHTPYVQGWTFLTSVIYRQSWQYYGWTPPTGPAPQQSLITNLILGIDATGLPIKTGAQITDALNVAITAGAPIQIGTIDPNIAIPSESARDLSCAEVIRRMLRWHPDCVVWWDYTTTKTVSGVATPCPTIHIRQRSNLTAVSFPVTGAPASGLDIAARPELVPPVVVLNYEQLNNLNDQDQRTLTVDKYPTGASATQPGAVAMTINLQGEKTTYMRQYLKTAEIKVNNLTWWQERLPWLNDANITNLDYAANPGNPSGNMDRSSNAGTVTAIAPDGGTDSTAGSDGTDKANASIPGGPVFPNFVIEGDIPNWITGNAQMVLCALRVNYDVVMGNDANGNPVVEQHRNETVLVKVVSTDLNTGWYNQLSGVYIGEPIPTGLAENYYNALAQLQYEGSWEITEQECGTAGGPYLGDVLNLTDGLTAWATMNAAIFETTENLATGVTRLRFGPVAYLSPKDWIAWYRVNRWREIGDRQARVNGLLTIGSHPAGGSGKHDRGGSGSKAQPQLVTWVGAPAGGNPGTYKIVSNPAQVDSSAAAAVPSDLAVYLRPIQICDGGTQKTILVLCSQSYTPTGG
jgi:hypothetical protein